MPKVFITGQSGSGKTTVLRELARRGYTTYNTDDLPGITQLELQETGEPVAWPNGYIDWNKYSWNWQDSELRKLLDQDDTVFIGAVVGNQAEYYHLFDYLFALTVNDAELRRRRLNRNERRHNDGDKNIEESVARNRENTAAFIAAGALPIASDRPVSAVVDDILAVIAED